MNISQAKEELIHTVKAYMAKDEQGKYRIPRLRQRPVLLMGPPGIGKTAIMEQVARECGVGLAAYTMTHHTRQSAIGLPIVQKRIYDGQEYTVTEYTMSEIIASVYSLMERTGHKEGILFLDEINCVSETLAPVMLQFLQNKMFGNHKLPDGWIIAAAGNPKEYNKAARDFDIATLDRVRRMNILPDLESWKKYALSTGIHVNVFSYLICRPDSFYHIHQTMDGLEFVTARGWEDLSVTLQEYERQGFFVGAELIEEYISCEEIARDFYSYYLMAKEYQKSLPLNQIVSGELEDSELELLAEKLKGIRKDESFSVASWLLTGILSLLNESEKGQRLWKRKRELIQNFGSYSKTMKTHTPSEILEDYIQRMIKALKIKEENGLIEEWQITEEKDVLEGFKRYQTDILKKDIKSIEDMMELFLEECQLWEKKADLKRAEIAQSIRKAIVFLVEAFGFREELMSFMTGIYTHPQMKEIEKMDGSNEYRKCLDWMKGCFAEKQLQECFAEK